MQYAPDRSLIGFGALGAKPWQSAQGFVEIGNMSGLKIEHAMDKKTLRNFRTGIGNNNAKSQITAITGSFTLYDSSPAQLALLLRAKVTGVAAGSVTGEAHQTKGDAAEHVVFKNLVDTSQPVTVLASPVSATTAATAGNKGNGTLGTVTVNGAVSGAHSLEFTNATSFTLSAPGGAVLGSGSVGVAFSAGGLSFTVTAGATAFAADDAFTITVPAGTSMEAGIDYIVTPYGIQLIEGSAIGSRGVVVSYGKIKASVAEILSASQVEQTLHFAGKNDAQNGQTYDATLHRVSFDVISELPISSEEYVSYNVTFELLQDYTRTGEGVSQYYTIRQQES